MAAGQFKLDSLGARHGFSLTELLVAMGIIVVLMSILVVAVGGARESARVVTTSSTMSSLSQGVVQFREDVGYLPPILDEDRSIMDPPDLDDPNIFNRLQGWYSITSPAEYLLGYGHHGEDGFGFSQDSEYAKVYAPEGWRDASGNDPDPARDYPDESVRFGIRHPGFDGVWTSSIASTVTNRGTLAGRLERFAAGKAESQGQVLGPYLQLPERGVVGTLGWEGAAETVPGSWTGTIDPVSSQPTVYFPGDAGYDPQGPKVICDAWGSPIRYYRLNYPTGALSRTYPAMSDPYTPTLSQFIVLRPWEFEPGTMTDFLVPQDGSQYGDFNSVLDGGGTLGDSTTSYELQSGEFAFFSPGPDRQANNWQRTDFLGIGGNDGTNFNDGWHYNWGGLPPFSEWSVPPTEEVNEDNIVEVGS